MANQWFRFYSEFDGDCNVQMMSEADQRRLVLVFCARCREEKLTDQQWSFRWRVSLDEVVRTKAVFIENGFIDENWDLLNWNKRQVTPDSSRERTKRWRQKTKGIVTVSDGPGDGVVNVTDKSVTVVEERRGEEIRGDKNRLEQRRGEAGGKEKRGGELASIATIFSNLSPRSTPRLFPATVSALVSAGYTFSNKSPCKDCGTQIDWWRTPKGGQIPMNEGSAVVHMETCSKGVSA